MNIAPKWIAAAAALSIALTGATACDLTRQPAGQEVEIEDCDAEDWANREDDCGFTDADRRTTKKPAKPSPRTTRR